MKIGQPADKPATPAAGTGRAGPTSTALPIRQAIDAAGTSNNGAVESSAKVELSSTAATLTSSQTAVNAEFDAEKVERISQAIASNSYQVNPEAIADKLISNAQELLSKVAR